MTTKILIADDDWDIATILSDRFQSMGYETFIAGDGQEAVTLIERQAPDVVFLDLDMPTLSGMEALRQIRRRWPELPVIIITAFGSIRLAVEAMKEGAVDFLTKPFETTELETVIPKALERQEMTDEVGRLLGQISHDIKNLLMPLVLGTDLLDSEIETLFKKLPELEATKADASQKLCEEVIEILRHTTVRVQERMKEIADYIKCYRAPAAFRPCAVAAVVRQVEEAFRFVAERKGIKLIHEGVESLPMIQADESRLYNALYNLVNNALSEVSCGGAIRICGDQDLAGQAIELRVEDNGRGMPPEVRESLFTRRTISRKPGGTGLGSRIVKEAIDAHGGEIRVESTEGVGTTFTIRLPIGRMSPEKIESSPSDR